MFLVATALAAVGVVGVAGTAQASMQPALCSGYSACIQAGYTDHGYSASNGTSYWHEFTGDNCTNYAAYMEVQNLFSSQNQYSPGSASNWGSYFSGFKNSTPAVGSIAWWGGGDHVAYVENITYNSNGTVNSIVVSEDNWGGVFDWRVYLASDGANWPDGFLHFRDVATGGGTTTGPDSDQDGVVDTSDTCPNFAGAPSNRGCRFDGYTVSGNFVGNDGYTDSLTFYDYTGGNLGAFVSQGGANGLGQPQLQWTTGPGNWVWGASSFYAGNFAGNDSYTDVIGLYNYGNGHLGAFLFQGNGNGVGPAQYLWTTSTGSWGMGRARYVVGNYAGSDGKDDILALYGYSDNSMGVFVLAGNGAGVSQPSYQWSTGSGQWAVQNAEYVSGDFAGNDGYSDVIAFYQYAGDSTGAFLFQGGANGLGQPQVLWTTGQNTWNIKNARYFVGNFSGNDNTPDVLALYDLGGDNLGSYIFQGNGSGVSQVQTLWSTGPGHWNLPKTKAVAGMFGGSHTSIFAWYNYGSTTGGALLQTASPGDGVSQPSVKWTTTAGQWSWPAM